jgi:serine/threonine protein kinase
MIFRYNDVFEEQMARFYLAEMVLAVHALHTMGYVHRSVSANFKGAKPKKKLRKKN